jgi:pilus assembly protein Flp/PilA
MMSKLLDFIKNETGVTAIEYALLAGGVFLAIVVVVGQVGDALSATFSSIEAIF